MQFKQVLNTLQKFSEEIDIPTDSSERLQLLKDLIDDGETPEVVDASYSAGRFSFGDLVAIGYAEKKKQSAGGSYFDTWYEYTGPGSVVLLTTIGQMGKPPKQIRTKMSKGDETEHVEVDYS
tara:strand:+ start:27 stop:392 length:366 start_codon:yes stop_codon:yes gene_type:complete